MRDLSKVLLLTGTMMTAVIPIIVGIVNASPAQTAQSQGITRFADTPKWQAVSIKPCTTGSHSHASFSPGRLTLECQNLWFLVQAAYLLWAKNGAAAVPGAINVPIEGGPAWIKDAQYTISGKAEEAVKPGVMQGPMLQSLLEDRFKLRLHWENRDIPVYALVVAKSGPKLQAFKEGSCTRPNLDPTDGPQSPPPPAPGETRCRASNRRSDQNPVTMTFDAQGFSLDQFSRMLALDRPVINKTGIAGLFDFRLEYANPMLTADAQKADVAAGPSIFTAVEQLGLKLESDKGMGQFLVIDSIERPTGN
jgi:uncharacterized protein (TIGR03435 family)